MLQKKLHIVSLGCSKNQVDTEVMLAKLKNYELTDAPQEADLLIVNTCGFIDAAKQESISTVMRLHDSRKPDSTLVMAGCLSERYKDELQKELVEVDIFTGVADYAKIDELVEAKQNSFGEKVFLADNNERVIINSNYHAYIKIAEGCNQACSFCAIPSFKGKLQSRRVESIVAEVQNLTQRGYFDFSFVSQDSSSYQRDFDKKDGLLELIDALDKLDGDSYARILYLYPSTTSKELIEKIANSKKVLNYFDMPIQHISQGLLTRMKRGFGADKIKTLLVHMRSTPNSFVRTSVIIGHPTESDEDFEELVNFLTEFDFDAVSVFAYSDEEGTSAFEMSEKVPTKIINKRLKTVQKLLDKKAKAKAKKALKTLIEAVVEGESDEHEYLILAKAKIWAPNIDGELLINDSEIGELKHGQKISVNITQTAGKTILGCAV